MNKKRIVIVTNNIDGGVGTFLSQIAQLQTNTMTLSLLTLQKEIHTTVPLFSYRASFIHKKSSIQIIQEAIWLKKELSQLQPDVVLCIDVHAGLLTCFLKKFFFKNTRVIISNRNNIRKVSKEKLYFATQHLLKMCGHFFLRDAEIVCVSKGLANDFKKFFSLKKHIHTIYNGIDIHAANLLGKKDIEIHDKQSFSIGQKTILSIGRLEKQKDFETLIQAIQLVQSSIKDVQLLIIGDGSEKEKLQIIIKKLQLEKLVFILGWKKNVYPYLRRADVFVLSSHYEGFGFVLLEAMSQGIPVISTDCPFGPSEVLAKGKYGILTPIRNTKMMANHILQILKNKKVSNFYSKQSKKRILHFSITSILKRYKNILNELFPKIYN